MLHARLASTWGGSQSSRSTEERMNRGIWTCLVSLAMLASLAATALAETAGGPHREYPRDRARERSWRSGFEGRTYLSVHGGVRLPSGDFSHAGDTGPGLM